MSGDRRPRCNGEQACKGRRERRQTRHAGDFAIAFAPPHAARTVGARSARIEDSGKRKDNAVVRGIILCRG